jgi:hypothetical protein
MTEPLSSKPLASASPSPIASENIVARLRHGGWPGHFPYEDAAREIERLTALESAACELVATRNKEIERLRADNARLREWLLDMDYADDCEQCQINSRHERAALRGDPPRGTVQSDETSSTPIPPMPVPSGWQGKEPWFKVGDKVRHIYATSAWPISTVTEITEQGFKYSHEKFALDPYQWTEGGETYEPSGYKLAGENGSQRSTEIE